MGNLPPWVKKSEVADFFRQFGPLKDVILIRAHDAPERNAGYCFVVFGGPTADAAAAAAVEFDGVEFHGRVLTVRLDDGRRLKARAEERGRWAAGEEEVHRSEWHEARDRSRKEFKRVVHSEADNWQAVVSAFQNIKKVCEKLVSFFLLRNSVLCLCSTLVLRVPSQRSTLPFLEAILDYYPTFNVVYESFILVPPFNIDLVAALHVMFW